MKILYMVAAFLLFIYCSEYWPLWLHYGVWKFFIIYSFTTTMIWFTKLITWTTAFHFGIDFNIFPNYRSLKWNPAVYLRPVLDIGVRADCFDMWAIIFRMFTGSIILTIAYSFYIDPEAVDAFKSIKPRSMFYDFDVSIQSMYFGFQVYDIPEQEENKEEVITDETYADIDDLTMGEEEEEDN